MSRKKQVNQKITALYCRISLDDGGDNESMSISNQKIMLRDFAEKNGMFQYEYYVDDGYTGRNFNRPAFQRMIADIEAGKIGCVITKDLSRLGRNYIEAGSYIEIFFPKHNVRYIAITDGVDSLTRQEMDITPFKNILNDMYSRDISKKVLAGRMTRSRQGKFCGGQPPLGLMRDPEDRGHLILDPETAPVIRKIYDLALNGWGCMRIAKQLMEDKVPITRVKGNTACDVNYYAWGSARISHILRNPFYKGAHLVCRTHQKGIRSNTYDIIPREDWEIIEGCHEAIVTPEEWEQVQGGGELMNPDSTRIPTGTLQWPLPVAGTITSQFGHRVDPITGEVSSHTGTDIACAEGTPILAAADGVVTVANGLDSWGGSYGYYIQIDHGGGLETLYAHCSSICVTTGQQVQAGQVIGYVGHTGRATGSHLHFEIHINKIRKDAMSYFGMQY